MGSANFGDTALHHFSHVMQTFYTTITMSLEDQLLRACGIGDLEKVKLLVSHGAPIDAREQSLLLWTTLHRAAR